MTQSQRIQGYSRRGALRFFLLLGISRFPGCPTTSTTPFSACTWPCGSPRGSRWPGLYQSTPRLRSDCITSVSAEAPPERPLYQFNSKLHACTCIIMHPVAPKMAQPLPGSLRLRGSALCYPAAALGGADMNPCHPSHLDRREHDPEPPNVDTTSTRRTCPRLRTGTCRRVPSAGVKCRNTL